jgi:hypothetical protein
MNFLGAKLLLLASEEHAFWILAAIVEDFFPDSYTKVAVGRRVIQTPLSIFDMDNH